MSQSARLFRHLEATFCAGLLDDPVLLVRIRPLGRNLLFDCGQIHHLVTRVLKQTQAICRPTSTASIGYVSDVGYSP